MLAAAVKTWRICTSVPQTVTIGASVKLNFQIWKWEDWNPDILHFGCLMESVLRITASCWQLTFGSRWSENLIWPITLLPLLRLSEYTSSVWVHEIFSNFSQIRIIIKQKFKSELWWLCESWLALILWPGSWDWECKLRMHIMGGCAS